MTLAAILGTILTLLVGYIAYLTIKAKKAHKNAPQSFKGDYPAQDPRPIEARPIDEREAILREYDEHDRIQN